jgi:hypothetical protein
MILKERVLGYHFIKKSFMKRTFCLSFQLIIFFGWYHGGFGVACSKPYCKSILATFAKTWSREQQGACTSRFTVKNRTVRQIYGGKTIVFSEKTWHLRER